MRRNISTNSPSENRVGYSRAVVINNKIYVSGTVAIDETGKIHGKSVYEQTKFIFRKIIGVLKSANFSVKDVVIVRAYLVYMTKLSEFDKAFKEHFYKTKPACTLVGINALVDKELLVEIEIEAEK